MITHLVAQQAFAGEQIEIQGDAYRHLFRARRLAVGSRLRIVDGRGKARWATVEKVDRHCAQVLLADSAASREAALELTLLVAPPRPERASWLVEKATELGVVAIRFIASERAPRRYGNGQLERFRRVAAAALEQCHRSRLPQISGVHAWAEVADLLAPAEERWLLDVGAVAASPRSTEGSVAVAIGPEGGWSESERGCWQELNCAALGLGERILRVETAALAAAAKLLC